MTSTTRDTFVTGLVCSVCGREFDAFEVARSTCPDHAGVEGILDVRYDHDAIRASGFAERLAARTDRDPLLRYRELLPLRAHELDAVPRGWLNRTPLVDAAPLASKLGVAKLLIKDDGRQPTGSLKDRSSTLAAVMALGANAARIACASTGNAASSLAGVCARVGLPTYIFVPKGVAANKLAQIQAYGATVVLVEGDYDDAYWLCEAAVAELGWANRNCAVNPYLMEGKKTAALEIAEQLAGKHVDWLAVSVGDGCTVAALHKGLREMHELGVLPSVPRILAVQAEGASVLVTAFAHPSDHRPTGPASTVATAIAVREPRNWRKALAAVRDSGGAFVAVEDDEILASAYQLAATVGVYAEPGAAAGIAAIAKARRLGVIGADERVVHVVTGTGLKDPNALDPEVGAPIVIRPVLDDVIASLDDERATGLAGRR